MSMVDKETANWRLFGGGGLLIGGILWLVSASLIAVAADLAGIARWVGIGGLVVIAIGFALVAFGQTGSNGAVGDNPIGKVGLWSVALGFLAYALLPVLNVRGDWFPWLLFVLIGVGALVAAVIIQQEGVARGVAKWAMYLVALVGIAYLFSGLGVVSVGAELLIVLFWAFAALVTLTGLLYVLNTR